MRRPMTALVGQGLPRGQMLLERVERGEGLIRQRIVLDVFDAGFGLGFGPGPIRRAGPRLDVPSLDTLGSATLYWSG